MDAAVSDELEQWLDGDGDHTLGGLVEVFEEKSFALLFVLLLGVSALPLPTGGATHVFDIVAVIVAGQLVVGRDQIWIPRRWRRLSLGGDKQRKFIHGLLKLIRFLERFGLLVIGLTAGAFFAPPFSGLDTLPALGVVLLSVGVLLEDFAIVLLGLVAGVGGIVLEIVLGKAAAGAVTKLL
jgi:hypothetical protein